MFHMCHRPKRSMMNMDVPDMPSATKFLVAGAMVYFGAKMLMEELTDD